MQWMNIFVKQIESDVLSTRQGKQIKCEREPIFIPIAMNLFIRSELHRLDEFRIYMNNAKLMHTVSIPMHELGLEYSYSAQ